MLQIMIELWRSNSLLTNGFLLFQKINWKSCYDFMTHFQIVNHSLIVYASMKCPISMTGRLNEPEICTSHKGTNSGVVCSLQQFQLKVYVRCQMNEVHKSLRRPGIKWHANSQAAQTLGHSQRQPQMDVCPVHQNREEIHRNWDRDKNKDGDRVRASRIKITNRSLILSR